MKKAIHFVLALICLLPSFVIAQGNTNITRAFKEFNTFQIGVFGSPNICYRTLENVQRDGSIDMLIDFRNEEETIKWGYHAGISIGINATKHFGVELGVAYSNSGYETKLKDYVTIQPEPALPKQGRSIYNYNHIIIPFKANFFAGKGKVRFYGSFGMITNVLIEANETLMKKYEDGHKEYETFALNYDYHRVVFSGTVAAGIDVKFGNLMNLRVSPYFSHNIGRIVESPLSQYLWTTGIQVGYFWGW